MRQLTIGLDELRDRLARMGALVEAAVSRSAQAIVGSDMEAVEQVLRGEESINRLEMEIDNHAIGLLARYQPVACDLRFITAAMKVNTDLERMADLAADIARRAVHLAPEAGACAFLDHVNRMAAWVSSMVSRSITAFLERDGPAAEQILKDDDEADRFLSNITRELFHAMSRDVAALEVALELMFVVRNLERIADHATNIAEDVAYLLYGIDVRHHMGKVA
jgi:phosphate transport system protein